jgi:hypothetical protein
LTTVGEVGWLVRAGGFVVGNRGAPLGQDRPGIDARHRQVDRDAGVDIAVRDRPVDRLRPAVPGQQRRMNVEPATGGHRQRFRRQDLIEARHHHHVRAVGAQRADEGLGVSVGRHLDGAAEVTGDPSHQVGLGMGPLPARAANGRHQVDPFLDQVQQKRRAVVRRNAAEHHPEAAIVERRPCIRSRRHFLEVDRDHRELRLRPDADGELVEPGIVEGGPRCEGCLSHAIARRTIGGRCSSSP